MVVDEEVKGSVGFVLDTWSAITGIKTVEHSCVKNFVMELALM